MSDGGWWVIDTEYGLRVMYSSAVPKSVVRGPYDDWDTANDQLEVVLRRHHRLEEAQDLIMWGWAALAFSALVYWVLNWVA